eukprot:TRINITY_DN18953_c1_g1_i1.p1 TRINITY_DN18953_c1_g1~~TRINITY_DN18953_c1_g1_i1.p1  ORF type:complete len:418 (-),score=47.86 TRINITY_DN18953_c1_g1_i1:209-1399(-)
MFSTLVFHLVLALLIIQSVSNRQLSLGEDGSFKISQFTDLHLGESQQSDQQTIEVIHSVVEKEPDADLIVLSGDLVSGYMSYGSSEWFREKIGGLLESLKQLQVPYAVTLGNHDQEAGLSRREVVQFFASQVDEHELAMTQVGPDHISGASNYYLDVFAHNGDQIVIRIWFLDTMGKGCNNLPNSWGCVANDTVQWLSTTSSQLPQTQSQLLFIHIPIAESMTLWNSGVTRGQKGEDVNCPSSENGLFEVLKTNNITSVHFGHDHNNNYEGYFEGVRLAYGLKTGYGGYGPIGDNRGARIIKYELDVDKILQQETWLRYEDGTQEVQDLSEKDVYDKQLVCVGPDVVAQMHARGYPVTLFFVGCFGAFFACVWYLFFLNKSNAQAAKPKKIEKSII